MWLFFTYYPFYDNFAWEYGRCGLEILYTAGASPSPTLFIYINLKKTMKESSIQDIVKRIENTLNSQRYRNNLNNPKVSWIDISIEKAIETVLDYINNTLII